jgi:hypothetical protein
MHIIRSYFCIIIKNIWYSYGMSNMMVEKNVIRTIAFTELLIGIYTILGLIIFQFFSLAEKSPNVFIFVLLSSMASSVIGVGLFSYKQWARTVLVFFSGYVILTKILIFGNLLHFNGEILTVVPTGIKNIISVIYHIFLVIFFTRSGVKTFFSSFDSDEYTESHK